MRWLPLVAMLSVLMLVGCKGESGEAEKTKGCAQSKECAKYGQCTAKDGKCIAASDADCKSVCESKGRCTINPKTVACVAGSDAHCKGSKGCALDGKCTLSTGYKAGLCIAKKDEDCKPSDACTKFGNCVAGNAGPVPGLAASSQGGGVIWRLTRGELHGECIARSDEDCRRSTRCKEFGACKAGTYQHGSKQYKWGYCHASSDEDCKGSVVCEKFGRCSLNDRTRKCKK
jgi:hypothetical protein